MSKEGDRRAFLARVGQMAAALSVTAPAFSRLLDTAAHAEALERFAPHLDHVAAPLDLSPLSSGMHWRMLGPTRGGRTAAATGVPGRPNEFYFGAVNGGVWKTIDAGRVWEPVFDSQPVASIGAIAVAPSAPDVVYVGSGESTLRDSTGYGNGMYKSTNTSSVRPCRVAAKSGGPAPSCYGRRCESGSRSGSRRHDSRRDPREESTDTGRLVRPHC